MFYFEKQDVALCHSAGVQGIHPELVPAHRNPVIARRGSNVDLVCKGSNVERSDSDIYWKFNGEKITSSNIKKPQANEDWTTFKLSMTNVSENDVGEYQCVAAVDSYPHVNKAEASIYFQLSGRFFCFNENEKQLYCFSVWTT